MYVFILFSFANFNMYVCFLLVSVSGSRSSSSHTIEHALFEHVCCMFAGQPTHVTMITNTYKACRQQILFRMYTPPQFSNMQLFAIQDVGMLS